VLSAFWDFLGVFLDRWQEILSTGDTLTNIYGANKCKEYEQEEKVSK